MNHIIPTHKPGLRSIALKVLSLLLIFLISGLAIPAPVGVAQPQSDGWIQLANPQAPGGDAVALAVAPSDANVLYTLIDGPLGGMRFFRSQDAGASWLEIHFFPASSENSFTNLAVDPANPQIVYASGGTSLQRSVDGGEIWETLSVPGYVFAAVSSELLFAAGGTDSCGYGKISSLARSEDGGQTWKTIPLGCLISVGQIAVLPSQPDVVYLGVKQYAVPTSTLLKSMDGGQTWAGFAMRGLGAVFQLLIDPDDPQRLFASVPYGILASLNGGETWEWISKDWMGGSFRLALSGGSLYAVEKVNSRTSLYRTDDGGETWWESLTLLPEGAQTLQADPAQAGRLWAGLLGYGIFLTNNGGGTWTKQNSGINSQALIKSLAVAPSDRNVIYTAVDDPYPGVYRSLDGGQTWGSLLLGFEESSQNAGEGFRLVSPYSPEVASVSYPILEINKLLVHPLHPEIAWAATSDGIFETLDGIHWAGTLGGPINDLAVSPVAPDEPYAAMDGWPLEGIVARRTCDPVTLQCYWIGRSVDYRLETVNALRVDRANPQFIILGGDINTAAGRVTSFFQSQDGGMTSKLISQIKIDAYGDLYDLYDLAIAPHNSRHLMVTLGNFPLNNGKFYRSNDGGVTWLDETSGLPVAEGQVWPVVIDDFESTYLGTANGVFRQVFSQASWQPIGLQGFEIRALFFNFSPAPSLFAAGGDGSAWRLDLSPIQRIWLPLVVGSTP